MLTSAQQKTFLSFVLRFSFSAILLGYLFRMVDWEKTWGVVRQADGRFLIAAFAVFLVINGLILLRWGIFVRALELRVPVLDIVRFFFIGLFGNLFLPSAIGGDVIKVVGLCRISPQKAKVVASVILDRLSGFAGMILLAMAAYPWAHARLNDTSLLGSILLMAGLSSILGTVLFVERLYSLACKIFTPFPTLKKKLMNVHYDIVLLRGHYSALGSALVVSCFGQVLLAVTFYLVAVALRQDVQLIYFLIFVPMICVVSSLPSIGGLGVREAGTVFLLAKVGVDSGVAVSISLINFLFMIMVGLFGGVVFLSTRSSGVLPESPQELLSTEALDSIES